jgi:hypothetical protein
MDSQFEIADDWTTANSLLFFVGEFGAKTEGDQDSRIKWYQYMVKTMVERGYSFTAWDHPGSFEIYSRNERVWDMEILNELIYSGNYSGPEIAIQGNKKYICDGNTITKLSDNTDFGKQKGKKPLQKEFVIKNLGTSDLVLKNIQVSGEGFSVIKKPKQSLKPGADTVFTIKYEPSKNGKHAGTIKIENNDSSENPFTFTIAGEL